MVNLDLFFGKPNWSCWSNHLSGHQCLPTGGFENQCDVQRDLPTSALILYFTFLKLFWLRRHFFLQSKPYFLILLVYVLYSSTY